MGKIICDTNVWYKVADGDIPAFFNSGMPIHATHSNIDELSVTHNLIYNFDRVQRIVVSIFKHHNELILHNPVHYLIKKDDPSYQSPFSSNYTEILDLTEAIANRALDQSFFETEEVKTIIRERKEELETIAKNFNKRFEAVKTLVKEKMKKNEINKADVWKADMSDFAKYVAKDLIKFASLTRYDVSNTFDWGQVELFIKVLEQLLKELMLSYKTLEGNDWYDLTNLIYVEPGDQYYTYEDFWLRLIRDSGMAHYLAH